MTTYTWDFVQSFTVFLIIVFIAQALAVKLKSMIPMPLIYGVLFILGFSTGCLPKDMLLSANMIAVGTIAFNVLVIHSGTMINFSMLRRKRTDMLICLISTAILIVVTGFCLIPILGKGTALLAPGSVIGGGASCAIASRWVLDKNPGISVFPWMIFMFQGLFSVPIVSWALKKEAAGLLEDLRSGQALVPNQSHNMPTSDKKISPCERIPVSYKTTAYYLGIIMIAAFINQLLQRTVLASMNINTNVTALLLGLLLGSLGIMDRGPLFKSDSYGLLLLGLMGLMANTIANNPLGNLIRLLPAVIAAFVVSTAVLVLCGIGAAKIYHFRPVRGIALTMNCMMGFPVNDMLIQNASIEAQDEREKAYLASQLGPLLGMGTMLISNGISIFIVSVMAVFV